MPDSSSARESRLGAAPVQLPPGIDAILTKPIRSLQLAACLDRIQGAPLVGAAEEDVGVPAVPPNAEVPPNGDVPGGRAPDPGVPGVVDVEPPVVGAP